MISILGTLNIIESPTTRQVDISYTKETLVPSLPFFCDLNQMAEGAETPLTMGDVHENPALPFSLF